MVVVVGVSTYYHFDWVGVTLFRRTRTSRIDRIYLLHQERINLETSNEATRLARVEQRRILGEYYRDLATNYPEYEQRAKEIGPTLAWPSKPYGIPEFENA